ncbi:MAG: hypothetical protein LBH54_01570 [Clostridiales bacterium]|nr:hypothetical protein [Clostridiales bacterium]
MKRTVDLFNTRAGRVLCLFFTVCFIFSAVLFCYADTVAFDGAGEGGDASLFSGGGQEYCLSLPKDRQTGEGGDKGFAFPCAAGGRGIQDAAGTARHRKIREVSPGDGAARGIVVCSQKRDGKK